METKTINQPENPQEIIKQYIVGDRAGEYKILYLIGNGSYYFFEDGNAEPVTKEQAQKLVRGL